MLALVGALVAPVAFVGPVAADPGNVTNRATDGEADPPHNVCADVVVVAQPVGHVDCAGARDGVEELERALLRELRHLIA